METIRKFSKGAKSCDSRSTFGLEKAPGSCILKSDDDELKNFKRKVDQLDFDKLKPVLADFKKITDTVEK